MEGGLKEIEELRERIQALIRTNKKLLQEKQGVITQLALRERELEELKRRCNRQEQVRKEAYERLTALLERLEKLT